MNNAVVSRSTMLRAPIASERSYEDFLPGPSVVATTNAPTGFPVLVSGGLSGAQVAQPFYVLITPVADGFIAKSHISLIYEMGATWQEALRHYLVALSEHVEWLSEIEPTLSPSVQRELALLREYVRVVEH